MGGGFFRCLNNYSLSLLERPPSICIIFFNRVFRIPNRECKTLNIIYNLMMASSQDFLEFVVVSKCGVAADIFLLISSFLTRALPTS